MVLEGMYENNNHSIIHTAPMPALSYSLSVILFILLSLSLHLSPHCSPVLINGPTPLHCLSTWSCWGERGREHKRGRCQRSMNNGEGVDCDLSLSVQSAASAMFYCWTLHRPISINSHILHTHTLRLQHIHWMYLLDMMYMWTNGEEI